MIDKLKFNLGLSSKLYFSEDGKYQSMQGNHSECDELDFNNMHEEDQLIVEREIMMHIFGKFIQDQDDFNLNVASMESESET